MPTSTDQRTPVIGSTGTASRSYVASEVVSVNMRVIFATENALPGSDQLRILVNMFIRVCSPTRAGHGPAPVAAARLLLAGGVRA